jgi:hypothetical protein
MIRNEIQKITKQEEESTSCFVIFCYRNLQKPIFVNSYTGDWKGDSPLLLTIYIFRQPKSCILTNTSVLSYKIKFYAEKLNKKILKILQWLSIYSRL